MDSPSSRHGSLPRIGVLFSGGGRTLENLARKAVEGAFSARIAVAISSHEGAGGIERARAAGIPVHVVDWRQHRGREFSDRILRHLDEARVDWVALAGFVRYLDYPDRLEGRILNVHPSLLPAFGGRGFWGDRVHRAVIESGVRVSGCTVHFVDREYDHGPIVLQRVVPVDPEDTPETLAARVFAEECRAYPEALRLCLEGRVVVEGGRTRILQRPVPDGISG